MTSARDKELALLLLGDIVFFFVALWLTLVVRYFELPTQAHLWQHVVPFSVLFVAWVFVFFIAGLYDKHTVILKNRLPTLIVKTQIVNLILAAVFFFLIPFFGITPKTNLLIYLIISSGLITLWRLYLFHLFWRHKHQKALLIGEGPEIKELIEEVNNNTRYDFEFVSVVDIATVRNTKDNKNNNFEQILLKIIKNNDIAIIVADSRSGYMEPFLPSLFDLTFLDTRFEFIDLYRVYEDIFDRVPLSALRYNWFLEHIPQSSHVLYDYLKRGIDLLGCLVFGTLLVLVTPLVWIAMRIEGNGPLFLRQDRIGQYNKRMKVIKFRTMRTSEDGVWLGESTNTVTRVGAFLRKTSLDELPQIVNIMRGEMSLIGPRNDIVGLGTRLASEIPYYNIRYIIKPGITGWAQTHQLYSPGNISPQSIEDTKLRLAYDLFYVKNRSLVLDIAIAFRTLSTLMARFGSSIQLRYSGHTLAKMYGRMYGKK